MAKPSSVVIPDEPGASPPRTARPRVRDVASGTILATDLRLAHTHWTRLRGLLGTKSLETGHALWLKPCNQVHMFGMRYALDVVFLDDQRKVVHTVEGLRPGKISPKISEATSVLELPSGTLAQAALARGARLAIEAEDGDDVGAAGASIDPGAIACNVLLATLYVFFAIAHFRVGIRTGQWATIVPVVVQEALLVVLFLTRRQSTSVSSRPIDWALGVTGTFMPLMFRATEELGAAAIVGRPLQISGLLLVLAAVASLGRSIGVVAANRGVQTAGPYRVVRHPMYAAHMLAYVGYVLSYPSVRNLLILAITTVALGGRAVVEERFLGQDPRYREYLERSRWRFLPFVY